MNRPIYPDYAEQVPFTDYAIEGKFPSKFAKNVELTKVIGLTCPGCHTSLNTVLDHSDHTSCPRCDLKMQLFGNCLNIWKDNVVNRLTWMIGGD